MIEGKRDLLIHAIPDAVSNFSEACELMVKHKGETAIESAEGYLYYGKALLELSRVESGVLGNALDGVDMENSNFNQAVEDLNECLAKRIKSLPSDSRMIAETHYQLGVAQAHCAQQCADQSQQCSLFDNAEKSLTSAVDVLNNTMASLKKMESSDVTAKELAELTSLCAEIEERKNDHREMQKGTYKEEKDFVSIYKGIEVNEIATKKAVSST